MKHKMWSRLLSMMLAVMMIASIVPNSAFAEAASEIAASSQAAVEVVEETEEVTLPEEEVPAAEAPAEETPAVDPTTEPAPEPTAEPVTENEQPAAEPTQAPVETVAPSEEPSAEPTTAPEGTETPEGTAVPTETPAASATPAPSESPVPSETPVPTETPAPSEEPAIDGQALLDELMAIEDDEAFMKAVNELTEEQAAALEALGEEALAEYTLRVEGLTAPEETVELNAEPKEFTTAVDGVDGVTVTVKVPEGALPVDAELKADLIAEDSEEYAKAEQALEEKKETYDGMVALDIRFEVGGQEVEPLKEVEVSIDAQALLPEDADPETVAVQHLKEDETGAVVAVETVADVTEETGEVTVEAAPAEEAALNVASTFAVDGFSTFTITWDGTFGIDRSETFTIVDMQGNKLDVEGIGDITYHFKDMNVRTTFEQIVEEMNIKNIITTSGEEYVFQRAMYIDAQNNKHPVDGVELVRHEAVPALRMYDMVYEGVTGVYTLKDLDGVFDDPEHTTQLVYRKAEEADPGEVVTETDLKRTKTVTKNEDGTYDLTLSVSGAVGNITNRQKVDVVFVIDASNSMDEAMNGGTVGPSRTQLVGDAVSKLVTSLDENQLLDVQYSLVRFGTLLSPGTDFYRDASKSVSWTSESNKIVEAAYNDYRGGKPSITDPVSPGGTNYQAGLVETRSLLLDTRPGALRYVIFLSDGQPTASYNNEGETAGGKGYSVTQTDKNAAYTEAGRLQNLNGFFSIGVGNEAAASATDVLETLCDRAQAASNGQDENFKYFSAGETEDLTAAFDSIQGNITQLLCTNVTVTDTLSKYVQPVENAQANLTITDEDGKPVTTVPKENVRPSYNGGVLKINFAPDYKLEKGYTYTVTMKIEPSDQAYEKYAVSGEGAYDGVGELGTGEYEGEKGFFTNETATVKYQYNGKDQENDFLRPVIQVHPGELTITKEIKGDILEDSAKLGNLKDTLGFKVTLNNESSFVIKLPADAGENEVYTITDKWLKNLKPGTTYMIEEIGFDVEGYDCKTTVNSNAGTTVSGVISASTTTQVAFVNDYTALDGELTFTKTLKELCDDDTMALFTVEIQNTENCKTYYKTLRFTSDVIEQKFTITLPVGNYQIRELQTSGYTNGTITGAEVNEPDENGYYSFTVPAGNQINLSVTNTAKKKNPSIDTNIAINSFSNDGNNWTWVRK